MRQLICPLLLLLAALSGQTVAAARTYELEYRVEMRPDDDIAAVTISMKGERLPSRVVLSIDPKRHRAFRTTDGLKQSGDQLTWLPRGKQSSLRYEFVVDHRRSGNGYDSLMQADWAIFRGDKLVPPARVKSARGLSSRARLLFILPQGWSVVTPQGSPIDGAIEFDQADRSFDRPAGWMLTGKLGRRIEHIAGVITTVAAPAGELARRQDTLAFLNWNLPRLVEVFPEFPRRLVIITAADPMWRGGLSGPASLFMHSDRPLISENRTSTLLHELVHVAMGIHGAKNSDWIVEGFAEYYSLEILRRSGSISQRRYDEALTRLAEWGRGARSLRVGRSSGAVTAKAVLVMKAADTEIRKATRGRRSLDDVAAVLAHQRGEVSLDELQRIAKKISGASLQSLADIR